MALLILALLQRIFLMSSLMLLLVWLIFFMVLIKLLPILGTISGKTVKLMVLAVVCVVYIIHVLYIFLIVSAFGVVYIFQFIDKTFFDTWKNFLKDGKADCIGSNLSRK